MYPCGCLDSQVPLDVFCALMEEAIAARPRPRAYLTPSAPQKYVPGDSFAPVIDERSKQLAAKLRPKVRSCRCPAATLQLPL
jgi:hypothetical protein